jgi:hypothetical protein
MAEAKNSMSQADALQREIMALREKAESVATELSHRVQHAFDVKARLRENRGPLIGAGVGVAALITVVTLLKIRSARRYRSLPARMGRKLEALGTILKEPEKIVHHTKRYKPDYSKVMTALLLAGISLGTRLVIRRLSA